MTPSATCRSTVATLGVLLLASTAGAAERFTAASPVGESFRRQVNAVSASVPSGVWQALEQAGWRVQVAEFVIDAVPELGRHRPRGWSSDLTWHSVDAVHMAQYKLVVVAEKYRDARTGEIHAALRVDGVFRHELGHAFDAMHGKTYRSARADFVAAYRRDLSRLSPQRQQQLHYYLQDDQAGRQETFAEVFAVLLGGGSEPAKAELIRTAFPSVTRVVESSIAAYRPRPPAPTPRRRLLRRSRR